MADPGIGFLEETRFPGGSRPYQWPEEVYHIRQKVQENPDAQLTPDDLAAWEAAKGPIPVGAIVAMSSGWQQHMGTPKFRNADDQGVMHFPGFHIEAIEKLLGEHNVKGIFVDTLSLDFGQSPDFAVHYRWLPAQKWGMAFTCSNRTLTSVCSLLYRFLAAAPP